MNEIFQIINSLILENQKVELPLFGVFKGEIIDTNIHPVDNTFTPKYLKINFVLDKNAKGVKIIEELSKASNLTKSAAESQLQKFRNDILQKLKNGEKIIFKELGYMYWKAGHLYFEQDLKFNYLKESFGLGSFSQEVVKKTIEKAEPKVAAVAKPKKSYKKAFISIAAVIIVLVLAGGAFWKWDNILDFYNSNFNKKDIIVENTDTNNISQVVEETNSNIAEFDTTELIDTTISIDTNEMLAGVDSSEIKAETTEEIAVSKEEIETQHEIEVVQNNPDDRYFIIAGCFREYNKATDFVSELNSKGYNAEIRGKTNGLHRVIYSAHSNYSSALSEMKSIIDKEGRGPWIQKIK